MAPNIFYLRLIFLSCVVIQKIRNNQCAIKTKSVVREKKDQVMRKAALVINYKLNKQFNQVTYFVNFL